MPAAHPIRPALFRFLAELAENNDRDWFKANKGRYEDVARGPAMELVAAVAPLLARVSRHVVADPRPVGGSIFRIHRDVRFSKDKRPYKTHVGIHFRHEEGKDAHAPGYYLHLEPDQVFFGCGLWHPDTATARTLREAIAGDPAGWKKATRGKRFTELFELAGDSLKRPPAGFDADHPLIEDLKRKDFIAVHDMRQGDVTGRDFDRDLAALCARGKPLMRFLCGALGLPF